MRALLRGVYAAAMAACFAAASAATGTEEGIAARLAVADPAAGERVFRKCRACHRADRDGRNMTGPNLWGIVGGRKAAVEDFRYSEELSALGGQWSYAELDAYLLAPRSFTNGGRMAFALRKSEDRAAVIAFLRTRSDRPEPLPTAPMTEEAVPDPSAAAQQVSVGLPPGDGREEVSVLCSTCHSLRLVTQQGLGERRWDDLMDWMVEEQGMDELDPETRQNVVRYLAKFFGEDRKRN